MPNFDAIVPRRGTYSLKYDFAKERGLPDDLLPMWVADMDFPAPPEVTEALKKVADHGIFGYSEAKEDYFKPLQDWFRERFAFEPQRSWLKKTPGVVFAINAAVRGLTREKDAVLIQSPVYYPFGAAIRANGRTLVDSPLVYKDGKYSVDLDDFAFKIKTHNVKMFLLCSPHNPVGRVWTEEELRAMGEICRDQGCLVFSDEIHCDFVWGDAKHRVFNSLDPSFDEIAILATAPSKTFNLAGLPLSNVFIPNGQTRAAFNREVERTGVSQLSIMALVACREAYLWGGPWLDALRAYLEKNLAFAQDFLRAKLPRVRLAKTEGTYLLWLDFQNLGLGHERVGELIINEAKLWLDDGLIFGEAGRGFQRINMACPQSVLAEALGRLHKTFGAL
ncbi:MAG: pyridoxal phosphate-dependent aminotransferase [Deltaproteobacteria bacterium]|jgi:cystathionine beta-lyase|nr:pyridoxal phosphate-dependent aminotransferase [Deltaproteobacteria bacterium]